MRCFLYSSQISPVTKIKKNEMGGESSTYGGEVHTEYWRESPTERDHLEVPGADRRILKWVFKKWDAGGTGTGLIRLRIGSGIGLL